MLRVEAHQHVGKRLADEPLAHGQQDTSGAQALDVGQLRLEHFIEAQLVRIVLDQQLARLGQLDVAPPVLEEGEPDFRLELRDLAAHGRYGDAQAIGRCAHGAQLGGFIEIAEVQVLQVLWPSSFEHGPASMDYLARAAEIQRSILSSSMVRGMLPPSNIWS